MARIRNIAKDIINDPFATTTDDISEYRRVQSVGQAGTYLDITVGSAANYPVVTPTRYFAEFPERIDLSDTGGSRPIVVYDETSSTTLTRTTGTPAANEYRVAPVDSIRRSIVEFHSGQAGNLISYDFFGMGSVFDADEFNKLTSWVNYLEITSNQTITDTDWYDEFHCNHSSATGLITVTLPTVADNDGRRIRIQNTGNGLTEIDGEGSETISWKGNSLTSILLYLNDDYAELVSNGSKWIVERGYSHIETGWQKRSDWTNVHIGNGFTYDTKSSSGVDWKGATITDTNSQTAVCIYDTGASSASGTLYFYNVSSENNGVWTNNDTITQTNGDTCLVNEATGTSKNIDYNLYHGFGVNFNNLTDEISVNTTETWVDAKNMNIGLSSAFTNENGLTLYNIDSDTIKIQTGNTGASGYFNDSGITQSLATADVTCNNIIEFSI
jgi:hypothetical protein